jgi:hypothetical protein
MPLLPSPAGILPFLGIKFVGYTLAGIYLSRRYDDNEVDRVVMPGVFGIVRSLLGIASGIALAFGLLASGVADMGEREIGALLAPIRFGEWALLIWLFYERRSPRHHLVRHSCLGTLLSYALDVPAWAAWFAMPGRIFWC